jgi:hypothetical protein
LSSRTSHRVTGVLLGSGRSRPARRGVPLPGSGGPLEFAAPVRRRVRSTGSRLPVTAISSPECSSAWCSPAAGQADQTKRRSRHGWGVGRLHLHLRCLGGAEHFRPPTLQGRPPGWHPSTPSSAMCITRPVTKQTVRTYVDVMQRRPDGRGSCRVASTTRSDLRAVRCLLATGRG